MANGDNTGYYVFTLQFSTTINMGEYVKITPPERVVVTPDDDQCMGITNVSTALTCTISDTSVYVRLNPVDASV